MQKLDFKMSLAKLRILRSCSIEVDYKLGLKDLARMQTAALLEDVSTSHLLVSSCLLEGYHLPDSVGGIILSACSLIHFRHSQTG